MGVKPIQRELEERNGMSYLSHLECALCGLELEADRLWNLCPERGTPLLARYDLRAARQAVKREALAGRKANLWRYHEQLPVRDPHYVLWLGEGFTPLIHAAQLGAKIGFTGLYVKDEGLNPTRSFKERGLGAAVSRAYELGVMAVSIPSAGNLRVAALAGVGLSTNVRTLGRLGVKPFLVGLGAALAVGVVNYGGITLLGSLVTL
jgi:threonine synthase